MIAKSLPIAVTLGEPAGIGPDIILSAWARSRAPGRELPEFFVVGDPGVLARRAKGLGIALSIREYQAGGAAGGASLCVFPVSATMAGKPGAPDVRDAPRIIEAVETAVRLVHEKKSAAVLTCPVAKLALYGAGFKFPGHTEFLVELALRHWGKKPRPVMMIAGPQLRTVPVTIHIPLSQVPDALSAGLIVETARIAARDLVAKFGIARPRLAVSGLNPHAGEGGALGPEDAAIIAPAVAALRAEGIDATGPLPADTMFHAEARARYDAAICMYHDQALIPAKALGFDESVNVTLGLPFIRTSPDHGTAFDIAGTGKARPDSFIAALHMAGAMARRMSNT